MASFRPATEGLVRKLTIAVSLANVGARSAFISSLRKSANAARAALPGDPLEPVVGVTFGWPVMVAGVEAGVLAMDGDVAVTVGDWVALTNGVVAPVADGGAPVADGVGPDVVVVVSVPVAVGCVLPPPQPEVARASIVPSAKTRFEVAARMVGSVRRKSDMSRALTPCPPSPLKGRMRLTTGFP